MTELTVANVKTLKLLNSDLTEKLREAEAKLEIAVSALHAIRVVSPHPEGDNTFVEIADKALAALGEAEGDK